MKKTKTKKTGGRFGLSASALTKKLTTSALIKRLTMAGEWEAVPEEMKLFLAACLRDDENGIVQHYFRPLPPRKERA